MYYYGNNGYYGGGYGGYQQPCCNGGYAGYTSGYGAGAAIWIVLFILLVIIIGAITFIWLGKTDFNDPIMKEKQNLLTIQLITPLISIILAVVTTFLSRSKEEMIKLLKIIAIVSMCIIIVTIGMQINMNSKYTEEKFEEFYEQYEKQNEKSEDGEKISIGFTGVKLTTAKENYIEKSKASYRNFKIKSTIYIAILFDEDIHYK